MNDATDDADTGDGPAADRVHDDEWRLLVRKAGLTVSMVVLVVAIFYSFFSITGAIQTWFQDRWVPVAQSVFGIAVAGLAVFVVTRLTR